MRKNSAQVGEIRVASRKMRAWVSPEGAIYRSPWFGHPGDTLELRKRITRGECVLILQRVRFEGESLVCVLYKGVKVWMMGKHLRKRSTKA